MKPRILTENVFAVGVADWDRRLFDALVPLPDGTSYNSFLIIGSEKTALIDTVDPVMTEIWLKHLSNFSDKKIDFIIANHAEQDHSGSLPRIIAKYPEAKIVTTLKGKDLLMRLLLIPESKFVIAEDGSTLSLGDKTLRFVHIPWVHWPETMLTHLEEDKIVFSCDFFGSHLAASDLFVTDEATVLEAAKRYFAEIMMPYSNFIQKNLEKIKDLEIKMIAPSHGPIHDNPDLIVKAYRSWVFDDPKNIVVLPYISMHGSTSLMVNHLLEALVDNGVTVKLFNISVTDIGKLAMALVDAATVVIGSPTVLGGAHPNILYATYLINILKPNIKYISIVGSYGWGGRMVDQLTGLLPNIKAEMIDPIIIQGLPQKVDYNSIDALAVKIANKHKENNFLNK